MVSSVSGSASYPDFTNPQMRAWWANMFNFHNYEVGKTVHMSSAFPPFLYDQALLFSTIAFGGPLTFLGDLKILGDSEKYLVLDF